MDRRLHAFPHAVLYNSNNQSMEAILMNAMRKGVLLVLVVMSMILGLSAVANAQASAYNLTNVSLGAVYLSSDMSNLSRFTNIWYLNSTNFILNFSVTLSREFNASNVTFYLPVGVSFGNGSFVNGTTANAAGNITKYDNTNRIFAFLNNGTNASAATTYYFWFAVNISTSSGALGAINISLGNATSNANNIFRNITGNITVDTAAPTLAHANTTANDTVVVTFNELNGFNSTSFTAGKFYLNLGSGVNVTASSITVGNNNNSVILGFGTNYFPSGSTPTLFVNGTLYDFAVNSISSGSVVSTDTVAPEAINTTLNLSDGTTTGTLTIIWGETIASNVNTGLVMITPGNNVTLAFNLSGSSASVSGNTTTITILQNWTNALNGLRASAAGYNVTLAAGAVNDSNSNANVYQWRTVTHITQNDTTAPTTSSSRYNANLRQFNITFNEAMQAPFAGNLSTIYLLNQSTLPQNGTNGTSTSQGIGWFALNYGVTAVANTSLGDNRTIVFTLSTVQAEIVNNWSVSTLYYNLSVNGVVQDVAGNSHLNTSNTAIGTLTLDTTSPTVIAVIQNDSSPIKAGTLNITLNFTEAMDISLNPTIVFGTNNSGSGTRALISGQNWNNNSRFNFVVTLNSTIGDGRYELNITIARDLARNVMTANTTFGTLDTTPPVILYAWYEESGSLEDATPYDNIKQHGDRIQLFMSEDMTNNTVAVLTNLTDTGLITNSTTFRLLENSSANNATLIPAMNYTVSGRLVTLDVGGNISLQLRSRTTFQFHYPLAMTLTINDLAGNPANQTSAATIADYAVSMEDDKSTYFGVSACQNATFINTFVSNYSVSGSIQKYLGSWAIVLANATKANEGYRITVTSFAERIRQTGNRIDYPVWGSANCDLTAHAITVAAGYNLIAVDGFNKTTGAATTGVDQWLDSVNAGSHDFAHLINATNNVQYFGPSGWDTLIVNPYDTYWAWKTDQSDLFAGFGRT